MSHYFINDEKVKDQPFTFSFQIKEKKFEFESNQGVFSKDKLDEGTKILLNTVLEYESNPETVLDRMWYRCYWNCTFLFLENKHDNDRYQCKSM